MLFAVFGSRYKVVNNNNQLFSFESFFPHLLLFHFNILFLYNTTSNFETKKSEKNQEQIKSKSKRIAYIGRIDNL